MAKRKSGFKPKYTAGDIEAMYRLQRDSDDESRLRDMAGTLRTHVQLEHPVNIPPEYRAITREVRTPFLRDAWARIAASLVSKPPIVQVQPRDDNRKEYREAAADASRFFMAMMERLNKQTGEDTIYASTAALVRDGESVIKLVHVPDAWAAFPTSAGIPSAEALKKQEQFKKGADLPFAWRCVDRLSTVWGDGEYGDEWVIEFGEYPLPYAMHKYGLRLDADGRVYDPKTMLGGRPQPEGQSTSARACTKLEYFDSEEWHVVVNGVEPSGWPKPNPYAPHKPYFRARGHNSESLLYSLLWLVPRLDELITMKLNWSYLGAYPNPVVEDVPTAQSLPGLEGPMGDTSGAAEDVVWRPGKLINLPTGKKLSFLVPPPIGADTNELLEILRSLIEVAGIPSVMRGSAAGGDSGYLANQMLSAASMQYRLASQALQRQFEQALDFVAWLVPNIVGQTVYVQGWQAIDEKSGRPKTRADRAWLGLAPDAKGESKNIADVTKLGPASFQFRPVLPTDEQARAMIAVQLTNAAKPLISRRHALKQWLEEEDADQIIDEIYIEDALEQEPLKSMVIQRALEEAGLSGPEQAEAPAPAASAMDPAALAAAMGGGQPGMIPPGPGQLSPIPPGQAGAGMPSIPGLTMPAVPGGGQAPAQYPPGTGGGMPAGSFPGQPPIPPVIA